MDLAAFGMAIRALRRRRAWRQLDLARTAGVSQSLISAIERGHGDRASLRTLIDVARALDSRLVVQVRWRGGDLERLLDTDHAGIVAATAALLASFEWQFRVEVTYSRYRATGSIDILAWHAPSRTLLVIEVKTEITSAEAILRKHDEKARIAGSLARERFGWDARVVARLLVVEEASTARRRIERHAALFDASLPVTGRAVRAWLKGPSGSLAGRLFLSASTPGSAIQHRGGRHRVRTMQPTRRNEEASVGRDVDAADEVDAAAPPTILVGYQRGEY